MKHNCDYEYKGIPTEAYGMAADLCTEDDNGKFWISNGEYCNQVNYCPFCGVKAPVPVILKTLHVVDRI